MERLDAIRFAAETALGERDVRVWRAALRDIRRLASPQPPEPEVSGP